MTRLISFHGFVVVAIFMFMANAVTRLLAAYLAARNPDSAVASALGALT